MLNGNLLHCLSLHHIILKYHNFGTILRGEIEISLYVWFISGFSLATYSLDQLCQLCGGHLNWGLLCRLYLMCWSGTNALVVENILFNKKSHSYEVQYFMYLPDMFIISNQLQFLHILPWRRNVNCNTSFKLQKEFQVSHTLPTKVISDIYDFHSFLFIPDSYHIG